MSRHRGRRARRNGGGEDTFSQGPPRDITDDLNRLVNSNREVDLRHAEDLATRYGDTRTGDIVRRIQQPASYRTGNRSSKRQ